MKRKKNKLTIILLIYCSLIILTGCQSSPPDHCANWWYYWKDGAVVDDMDRVKYLWEPGEFLVGVSSPHKTTDFVGVSDHALDPIEAWWGNIPLIVTNKNNQDIRVEIVAARLGGIYGVAETIAHEFKHVWIYQQWGKRIGYTGPGHSDTDGIPDVVENDRTPGSIGYTYEFSANDPDTFDVHLAFSGWGSYATYGDNEVLARVEGVNNPRNVNPDDDWSEGGAQWNQQ